MSDQGYIVEFVTVGAYVKVSAVDPKTGVEVSSVGSRSATQDQLSDLAIRKLEYVLKRKGILPS